MGKRTIVSADTTTNTDNTLLVEINNLIAQLSSKVVEYLGSYTKTTQGKKSTGDVSLQFLKDCYQGVLEHPEILAPSFDKEDFSAKLTAIITFNLLEGKIFEAISDKWATNLMICKTDAMNYANEFYGIVQREANKDVKYQPLLDTLKSFYKKSKTDNSTTSATDQPPTTPTSK